MLATAVIAELPWSRRSCTADLSRDAEPGCRAGMLSRDAEPGSGLVQQHHFGLGFL